MAFRNLAGDKYASLAPIDRWDAKPAGAFLSPVSAALCAKYQINIHTFMKNTDDFNLLAADLLIEDDVATLREFTISDSDFIACFTDVGVFS